MPNSLQLERLLVVLLTVAQFDFPAIASSNSSDGRVSNENDVVEAREALKAMLPEEHEQYLPAERGPYRYGQEKFVVFSTRATSDAISRTKRVTCTTHQRSWVCQRPSTYVFAGGHSFPEPPGVDDATILNIVEFVGSICLHAQARTLQTDGRWMGPPLGSGRVDIRQIRRVEGGYIIDAGNRSSGNTLTVEPESNRAAACKFRLRGVGYYVSEAPNTAMDSDTIRFALRAPHGARHRER
jgi:hypothetical protein